MLDLHVEHGWGDYLAVTLACQTLSWVMWVLVFGVRA